VPQGTRNKQIQKIQAYYLQVYYITSIIKTVRQKIMYSSIKSVKEKKALRMVKRNP